MRVKKVPLQDLELWPDEVICFTAYTDTRNPVQQRRTYVDGTRYAELQAENAKLREQIHWLKKGDILHVLTDQEYIDQCERERLMQVSIDALDKENAKLRELVHKQDALTKAVHAYWAGSERSLDEFNVMMDANA